jgi:hypothetical protein
MFPIFWSKSEILSRKTFFPQKRINNACLFFFPWFVLWKSNDAGEILVKITLPVVASQGTRGDVLTHPGGRHLHDLQQTKFENPELHGGVPLSPHP